MLRRIAGVVPALCALAFLPVAFPRNALGAPPEPAQLCDQAVAAVEPGSGVRRSLMGAISRVEAGRTDPRDGRSRAWPWTINAEGRGQMFASKTDAMAAVAALRERGVASIDVGCMQVNLHHHPTAFANLEEAFDPLANVRYAARFLVSLYAESRDWPTAVGHYHSRDPDRATRYEASVLGSSPAGSPPRQQQSALVQAWSATVRQAPQQPPARSLSGYAALAAAWR